MPRATTMRPPPLPLGRANTSPILPMPTPATPRTAKKTGEKGRQSYSCAECRRLKLKCSRVWPCINCDKRGCAQICPNGEMKTGKGKRLILADTEELHQRISELEVALAQSHAASHATAHPLLESPYLFHSRDSTTTRPKLNEAGLMVMDDEDEIIDGGLGTLTISGEGEAHFVGSFAGSEYLRGEAEDRTPENGLATPPMSATAGHFGPAPGVMFSPMGVAQGDIGQWRQSLPDWHSEGKSLVDTYWENVDWMYQILPKAMFESDHLVNAYDRDVPANAHKIACVFLVMALGAMFDLNREPYDPRGEQLFALGRACIGSVGLEHASPATVQALHLCGTYMLNDKDGNGAESFWPMLGTAVKVAQSLGLHRDGETFGLSPYEIEERRQVWWEIVTYDRLQALCFGRPCASTNRTSDTHFPEPSLGYASDVDEYHRTKYRLIMLMEKIIDIQTQTTSVSVQQVKQLDTEFREFGEQIPEVLLPKIPIPKLPLDSSIHPHLIIHRLGIRLLVAQSRLLLNRPSFARALGDNPNDPSWGKFGDSFVGLYESAQEIVQLVRQLVVYHPSLIARWWFFWFHAFTASVCLAAIAIRAPTSAFASPAFHGMTTVCDISAVAHPGCRAKKGLPILLRLRKRAAEALTAAGKVPAQTSPTTEDDDLSHLQTSAKLRRVGSSPPSKKDSPSFKSSPPQALSHSPTSPRSVATSATLADPIHYDAQGNLLPMNGYPPNPTNMSGLSATSNAVGAVQPPPPPGLQPFTPGTSAWLNLSPLDRTRETAAAQPFTFTWLPGNGNTDLSPNSLTSNGSPGQMFGIMEMDMNGAGGPIGLGMNFGVGGGGAGMQYGVCDFSFSGLGNGQGGQNGQDGLYGGTEGYTHAGGSAAYYGNGNAVAGQSGHGGHGGNGGNSGHGANGGNGEQDQDQGIFKMDGIDDSDWQMFVNQMAVGEVGLDGNWQ